MTELTRRGYPCALTEAICTACVGAALRELNAYKPCIRVSSFDAVVGKQDYLVFDNTKTEGILSTAVTIQDVWLTTTTAPTDLPLFDPYAFLVTNQNQLQSTNLFEHPTELVLLRQRLGALRVATGLQGWDLRGYVGGPTTVLHLGTAPSSAGKITVQWGTLVGLENIVSLQFGAGRHLMQWVETFVSEAMANAYSETAGVDIVGVKLSDGAMRYWERKAAMLRKEAMSTQGGAYSGIALRTD